MQSQLPGDAVREQPDFSLLVPFCAGLFDALPEFGFAVGDGQGDKGCIGGAARCRKSGKLLFVNDDFHGGEAPGGFRVDAVADADKRVAKLTLIAFGAGLPRGQLFTDAGLRGRGVGSVLGAVQAVSLAFVV